MISEVCGPESELSKKTALLERCTELKMCVCVCKAKESWRSSEINTINSPMTFLGEKAYW
jgi:hypothetical protein